MNEVRHFKFTQVKRGERWIYSADFNVKDAVNPHRVDEELGDIQRISDSGGIAVILAHEGSYGKAKSLEFVASYLSEKLQRKVHYYDKPIIDTSIDFTETLKPGEIVLMGNTRFNEGEERNAPELAYLYAHMGDKAVIGGFGKAHRINASNVGILDYRSGYISSGHAEQMRQLDRWKGTHTSMYSVAVLGGVKKEKITVGLQGFAKNYDAIIPGGIVLNTILKCEGYDIGQSIITDGNQTFVKEVSEILREYKKKIIVPEEVIVARKCGNVLDRHATLNIKRDRVPEDSLIVSYIPTRAFHDALGNVARTDGRLVVAGTPDIPSEREGTVFSQLQYWMKQIHKGFLVLGGDSVRQLNVENAVVSTGGGAALQYLTTGKTHVYEKLKENLRRRGAT